MDKITRILEKLNQGREQQPLTLVDLIPLSLAEVRNIAGGHLSREESQILHYAAIKEKQNNILFTARALTRANPLLRKEMGRARRRGAAPYGDFDDIVMPRADEFAAPGSVSSMFSPAGYLTELYREARGLHQTNSTHNLDKRRPDLAKLVLSQENLDKEVSTLMLANDQLETALMAKAGKTDKAAYDETLATSRYSGVAPYNAPFELVREAMAQQDFSLPDNILSKGTASAAQLALSAGISPALYTILTEKTDGLSDAETDALVKKNFPGVNTKELMNLDALANYYELPRDEIQALPGMDFSGTVDLSGIPYGSSLRDTPDLYGKNKTQKIKAKDAGGDILYTLTQTRLENESPDRIKFEYIDLIPLANNQFCINFNCTCYPNNLFSHLEIGIKKDHFSYPNDLYINNDAKIETGKHYSIPVTINSDIIPEITISVNVMDDKSWEYGHSTFTVTKESVSLLPLLPLLQLNKTLRLAKACGLSPLETQRALTRLHLTREHSDENSDTTVLLRFTEALHYSKRYSLDMETALILCGATISQDSDDGQLSQFDRLFNNPPLNGCVYSTGGTLIPMKTDEEDPRRDVLKRAFRVDNTGLYQLFDIILPYMLEHGGANNTIEMLSRFWRLHLLADVHHLTVAQLHTLWLRYPGYNSEGTHEINEQQYRDFIHFIYQTTQWLTVQNITAEQLSLLLTTDAPATPTREMNTLLDALRNGGIGSTDTDTLRASMAPVIAAAMQLESPEQGESLLRWLDNNHPGEVLITKDIWPLITTEKPSADQQKKIAAWCQTLAQRVLVIRTFTFSDTELQILSQGAPADSVAALRDISDFHNLINRCGDNAGTVLDALQDNTLTVAALAGALNLSESVITQALTQAGQETELTTWQQLATLPSRLDLADTLHITPKDITNLLTVSDNPAPSYAELTTLSGLLQSGLNEQLTTQLNNRIQPRRSEALSGEYRTRIMGKATANRDDIWRELLIDGKVSADITTTRLADAIAGIQLYVNRTIAGDEPGAISTVLARQFFKDWDTYNKRYSTWAGVSQLVYYPENTIDPTLRTGQTGMMNTMLEQLSQSELNSDTLEDGFRQYLTAFEQVADLKVISGYHDTVSIDEGNTWFVGTSQTEPKKYYWRKADHSKCQNGHFAANAWSEWKEITCAVSPYQNMVRPVVYRSRLYLLWAEQQIRKDRDGNDDILSYTLKLTHIKYDGSWASPFSYDVTPKFSELTGQDVGLYCAADYENDILSCIFYTKETEGDLHQSTVTPKEYAGLHILADMEQTPFLGIDSFIKTVIPQLDTVNISRINTTLENMNAPTLDPEEQQGSPDLALGLDLISYNLRKEDQKYFLSVEPVADVTINVSTIPEPLRPLFADKYSGGNYALYEFTDTSFSSENTDIPGGKCSLYILCDEPGSTSYVYLTLPSGNKQPDLIRHLLLLAEVDSEHGSLDAIRLQWENSDSEYHYFSSVTRQGFTTPLPDSPAFIADERTGHNIGKLDKIKPELILPEDYPACPELRIINGDTTVLEFTQSGTPNHPAVLSDGSFYFDSTFSRQSLDVTAFVKNNQLNLPFKIDFKRVSNAKISGSRHYNLTMKVSAGDSSAATGSAVISLHTTPDSAQYMEWDAYRTRLNTLFARQLIARANRGIDAVLSPETQNLREPKPGEGTYVTLTLKPYDPAIHGSDRSFTIRRGSVIVYDDRYPVIDGTVSTETSTTVNLFLPRLGYQDGVIYLRAHFQSGEKNWILFSPDGNGDWQLNTDYNHGTFPGLESVSGLSQPDEPMDFSGANALYFWELFYYTPMMVAMRLLQEQNFTEAHRWLGYIWRPAATGAGDWRVRPLLEDTAWNADPLDSVDPDAVAQNDPMHYKVSTIMKMLDLLIARGDSAYRMLERDTLNEAKMWYMQALGLLGDKPVTVISGNWNNPALSEAADDTREQQRHQAISALRHGGLMPERHSANTLTGLFLPQQNEKLLGYWQTLDMRLFNLRNNLAIDGQPLSLPIFAAPADPAALLSAAAAASGGSKALPSAAVPAMRFPQALESARSLTGQLMQFGATLQGLIERQDAEAMSELLQNQAGALMLSSLRMQEQALAELDAEKKTLEQSRAGAQSRFDSYRALYDENVSAAEQRTMDLYLSSSVLSTSAEALAMAEAVADMAPNVFGMAVGGSRWGGIPKAIGSGISLAASATKITADNISQSEAWRRRRQEWEIQKNSAESEVRQIDAQLDALTVRRTAAEMQREYLEIQQAQTQAQLEFLQRKFSNKALYSWLRGRLAAVYYRFYDLTAARCMMAEAAYGWQTGETTRYIKPGAWQSAHAGLMAGESLLLNLTEMEQAWLKWDHRALEVTRTVSLADVYSADKVDLAAKIAELLTGSGSGSTPAETGLSLTTDKQLHAAFNLKALNIAEDYPAGLGKTRRIRQISVTLPALTGPYQDVRAVLSYGGDVRLPDGCKAIAVSHGMNDSGQFQLDFSDGRWLPFEGIAVDNDSSLTLSFPGATTDKQKALLLSLSDIIVHIRYTIR
ncbi:neuraminidase-like domain-containing protein [Morganella morganii]|uniref:Tc toxin subunit A-related protein n=2 Tax=Morganella morganii TaxID=582 RepID=UPI00042694BF|nr:neuraminidase-like domain-containing protein [Morganella morganii]HCR3330734.1 insecticidal toxin protein [Morganella morganii]